MWYDFTLSIELVRTLTRKLVAAAVAKLVLVWTVLESFRKENDSTATATVAVADKIIAALRKDTIIQIQSNCRRRR